MFRMKLLANIIVLLLLLSHLSRGFRASPRGGIIQQRVSRLQQSGLLNLDNHPGDEIEGEGSDTPESGTDNNDSENDADTLYNNVRTFDPAMTLA